MGGLSCIDSVILRDRDANRAWTAASDATLEERRYLVQNWRADVTTMVNTSGEPIEWYRYTAYGQPTSHPIADLNGDGSVTSADTAAWLDVQAGDSSGSVWLTDDLNRDDVFPGDTADDTFFYAQHATASGLSSGYDRQSAYGLRKGYAGYEWDDTLTMWQVRHRVLDSKSGKWTKRDPLGYVDGMSVFQYVESSPLEDIDPEGLMSWRCGLRLVGLGFQYAGVFAASAACTATGPAGALCIAGVLCGAAATVASTILWISDCGPGAGGFLSPQERQLLDDIELIGGLVCSPAALSASALIQRMNKAREALPRIVEYISSLPGMPKWMEHYEWFIGNGCPEGYGLNPTTGLCEPYISGMPSFSTLSSAGGTTAVD